MDRRKDALKMKLAVAFPLLNEKQKRVLAALEARGWGYGGVQCLSEITGLSRTTIHRGLQELEQPENISPKRVRKKGGGRKKIADKTPGIVTALEHLMEWCVLGDPESPLRWTCKSVRLLRDELVGLGYKVSHNCVAGMLRDLDYSLQANKKTRDGDSHPDRNGQFEFINRRANHFISRELPVISVDTKKKELIGEYRNNGREWGKKGRPVEVNVHDFPDPNVPKAVPYGVYDVGRNEGWVSVGISGDTAQFAVESIRRWWGVMGKKKYPGAKEILVCADSGGSNSYRSLLWKWELYGFAREAGLSITVCHYPPGTSKWNKIEHKMFSFISMNWRGRPLTSYQAVVNLIASTSTKTGLTIHSEIDKRKYERGIKITKKQFKLIPLKRDDFHGEWNYTIL